MKGAKAKISTLISILFIVIAFACGFLVATAMYTISFTPEKPSEQPPEEPVKPSLPPEEPVKPSLRPIVFVHGGAGSAQQFESQAMRFTSNGYPPEYIKVFEYDSSHSRETLEQVLARLDSFIDDVLKSIKAEKVDLIGHSYGGLIAMLYIQNSTTRGKVSHCVIVDSLSTLTRGLNKAPEDVEVLAIWGAVRDPRYPQIIYGARNVYFHDQQHVEVCTSAESFVEMFKFFTGKKPSTKDIIPESEIYIAGRVVIHPLNVFIEYPEGRPAILEIWEVNASTGYRVHDNPIARFEIKAPEGKWGPVKVKPGVYYEFCLIREGLPAHHIYREPFHRSNYWITLLTSLPGGVADQVERSDSHAALLIIRNKEFLGDLEKDNDILKINDVNIITSAVFTKAKMVISVWLFDKNSDKVSNITQPLLPFHQLTFQTGLDLYIPATDPPTGTIKVTLISRGSGGIVQVINIPDWASSKHRVTIQFNDYVLKS